MKLLVFDIDGTLTDSVSIHQTSYLNAYSVFDLSDFNTDWGSYAHHSDSWIFGEIIRNNFNRSATDDERRLFASTLSANFESSLKGRSIDEVAGARAFLKSVFAIPDLAYVFATGSLREPALRKLESLEIQYPPELLVTASEFETREEIVAEAINVAKKYFNIDEFTKIISFGDGYWDLVTAKNLGIEFVGIASGEKAEKLLRSGAEFVYPDFTQISPENLRK